MAGNPETITVGDKLMMTDLRVGETYPVTVERFVDAAGTRVVVRRDDTGVQYKVHKGFLTERHDA